MSSICRHSECCRYYLCAHPKCCGYRGRIEAESASTEAPECVQSASCEEGDHTYSWPCVRAVYGDGSGFYSCDHCPSSTAGLHYDDCPLDVVTPPKSTSGGDR